MESIESSRSGSLEPEIFFRCNMDYSLSDETSEGVNESE